VAVLIEARTHRSSSTHPSLIEDKDKDNPEAKVCYLLSEYIKLIINKKKQNLDKYTMAPITTPGNHNTRANSSKTVTMEEVEDVF
jgi:hypothetical protein